MLTVKDLSEKAGITPTELRKLLRKEFNRAGKTEVEGNCMEYRFDFNDPTVKQIIDMVKGQQAEKSKPEKPWNRAEWITEDNELRRRKMANNSTNGQAAAFKPLVGGSNPPAAAFTFSKVISYTSANATT